MRILIILFFFLATQLNAQVQTVFEYQTQEGDSPKSLLKTFGIDSKALKAFNPDLPKRFVGSVRVRIPMESSKKYNALELMLYQVSYRDTWYKIAFENRIFDVEALIDYNRRVRDLESGTLIQIPYTLILNDEQYAALVQVMEENYELYRVEALDTQMSIEETFELEEEELFELNPQLNLKKTGIEQGMLLIVGLKDQITERSILEDEIKLTRSINVSFMLPLKLQRTDTLTNLQTFRNKGSVIDRVSDYYLGAMMAIDSLRSQGAFIETKLYDTENNSNKVREILALGDLDQSDLIIGPFYSKKAEHVSRVLPKNRLVFPMYSRNQKSFVGENFIKPVVDVKYNRSKLNDYIKQSYCDEHILIVGDTSVESRNQKKNLIESLRELNDSVSITLIENQEDFVNYDLFRESIDSLAPMNWVVVTGKPSKGTSLVDNIIALQGEGMRARLFMNERPLNFDSESDDRLARVDYTYIGNQEYNIDDESVKAFYEQYRKRYFAYPTKAAVIGFDETYDLLIRLIMAEGNWEEIDFYSSSKRVFYWFEYGKSELGPMDNQAGFIWRYNKDWSLFRESVPETNIHYDFLIEKEEDEPKGFWGF